MKNVNALELFKEHVLAGIVPSTVFPDIDMPRAIYLYIIDHYNERMIKCLDEVTNDNTFHNSTHDYWTLKLLGDFDNKSSANSELVAEEKSHIKANLSEETETDDEKASGDNDGMEVEDGEENISIKAQRTPEVDDKVGSKTKIRRNWRRSWNRRKERKSQREKQREPV